jgi:hypothetical protein
MTRILFHSHPVPTWNARHLMDARPRCAMHDRPSQSRPNLFAGD